MNRVPDIVICFIIVITFVAVHILTNFLHILLKNDLNDDNQTITQLIEKYYPDYGWLLKLLLNCIGYSCIFIPGILIYKYTRKTNYLERSDNSLIPSCVRFCLTDYDHNNDKNQLNKKNRSYIKNLLLLLYCFFGLMITYLTWGVLQEQIMTREYENADGVKQFFTDSQFLVFANRLLAFLIAFFYLSIKIQSKHKAPIFKYSYASLSNIMSAWFQYEALKFINFPTQVLAKSCKIIPVMIMGKFISKNKYEKYEYVTAIIISIGMFFFLTGSNNSNKVSTVTTLTGYVLLIAYMVFDSFTSNWQGELFKKYTITPIQMMCGVNLFSTLFTAASLSIQGGFLLSIQFAIEHPVFIYDCIILSISSAIGQLFIFFTISTFDPVIFTIIMTIRQALAILLSCLIYHHKISIFGIFGIIIVFLAIFLRMYCSQRIKSIKKRLLMNPDNIKSQRINV